MSEGKSSTTNAEDRVEWIIRLRFGATEDEARKILDLVTDAIGQCGTISSLSRDDT